MINSVYFVSLAEAESPGFKLAEHDPKILSNALTKQKVRIHSTAPLLFLYLKVTFLEPFSNTFTIATFNALESCGPDSKAAIFWSNNRCANSCNK